MGKKLKMECKKLPFLMDSAQVNVTSNTMLSVNLAGLFLISMLSTRTVDIVVAYYKF